ncbi:MAG: hypothetical protein HY660_10170 [Armatimonadetes bacterium]|nr:hypothetical protein [Armatimonadota bacterium]
MRRGVWARGAVLFIAATVISGLGAGVAEARASGRPAASVAIFSLDDVAPELVFVPRGITPEQARRLRPSAVLVSTAGFHTGGRAIDLLVLNGREVLPPLPLGRPIFGYDAARRQAWVDHRLQQPATMAFAAGPYFHAGGVACQGYTPGTFCTARTVRRALAVDTTGRYLLYIAYHGSLAHLPKFLGTYGVQGRPVRFLHGLGLDGGSSVQGPVPVRFILRPRVTG